LERRERRIRERKKRRRYCKGRGARKGRRKRVVKKRLQLKSAVRFSERFSITLNKFQKILFEANI